MIEKRLVQWYASSAGVDLDIAEREIVLTYVLQIMADEGILDRVAFKGGTAIRKLHLGNQGRFSLDLDFTSMVNDDPEDSILEFVDRFNGRSYFDIDFGIDSGEFYATGDSCGAELTYNHEWVTNGRFAVQISFRAEPVLRVLPQPLLREQYFEWLGITPPEPPALDLHEIIAEKIRAAAQRSRVRDLYDLYAFSTRPYDRDLVRQIAVLKCWETNYAFAPQNFLEGIPSGDYDWADLRRLVKRSRNLSPEKIIRAVQQGYSFLIDLTAEEAHLAEDPYQRQYKLHSELLERLQGSS
jgi:predicted nucleotidyltransferase component of viral defense system